jgi:MFS family permease
MVKEVVTGSKEEKVLIEKTKKLSVKEAGAYSFMDGFGLRYITPYALSVGATNTQIGLLSSVPGLLGNLSQLATFKLMGRFKRKSIVYWGVLLQAIMWLVLLAAGIPFFLFNKSIFSSNSIIIVYTLLIFAGAIGGPAWSSMMRDLVSTNRGEYFGRRSRIAGTIALICMFIGGFILDYFKQTHIYIGFIILFGVAFIGRFISAMLFKRHYEPKFKTNDKKYFTIFEFIKKMRHNNFGRFVLYFAFISLATAIAGPFFAVYMLKNLGFSYTQYMLTILANSISTVLLLPFWGKFADKYGNWKVMKINGMLIPLLPFLWMLTPLFGSGTPVVIFLIFLEIYSGLVWSGFNLSAGNYIYDAVSRDRLAICSSYFNILNGFGALVGATIGGYLSTHGKIFGLTSIFLVFFASGIARLLVHVVMSRSINEVRPVEFFSIRKHVYGKTLEFWQNGKKLISSLLDSVSMLKFWEATHTAPVTTTFAKNN